MGNHPPPIAILCVDVVSDVKYVSVKTPIRTESLRQWQCQCLRRADGQLLPSWSSSGKTAAHWWDILQHELRHPNQIWIVSWQCGRAWALMDLWDMLETGQIRVAGGDHRAVYDPVTNAKMSKPGILIAEDPPNIAELRVGTQPGRLLWLDCRNWGIDLDPSLDRGQGVVGALSELVARMDMLSARYVGAPMAPTAAGHAWRAWRSGIALAGVHCHANQAALDLERNAHFGGRCEAFRLGKLPGKWFHLDFRSHYGAIMAQEQVPLRLVNHLDLTTDRGPINLPDQSRSIARVTITTNEPAYPLLREHDLIYPTGTFQTCLCGPELVDAVERGRVKAWHEIATYEVAPVLADYAKAAYFVRALGDDNHDREISQWAKSLLNSLPGKLGYRFRCWETQLLRIAPEPNCEWHEPDESGKLIRWRAIGGVCQREVTGGYGPDAVPAMAAWICSHGRHRLLRAIRHATWQEVAYVDTDSLIVSTHGLHNLELAGCVGERGLGVLEVRSASAATAIFGVKHYIEDGVVKCAGSPRGVTTTTTDGTQRWYTPPIAGDLARHRVNGDTSHQVSRPEVPVYRHGVVMEDGRVRPHKIG